MGGGGRGSGGELSTGFIEFGGHLLDDVMGYSWVFRVLGCFGIRDGKGPSSSAAYTLLAALRAKESLYGQSKRLRAQHPVGCDSRFLVIM